MEHVGQILTNLRNKRAKAGSTGVLRTENPGVPLDAQIEISRHQQQLIDTAADIRERWPLTSELSFMAKHLVQVTLPHRDPGDVPLWTRTNGDLTLVIARTGVDEEGAPIGYPYGTIPRLLLYWITSEAVRTKSRHLELGHSLADFMREVGLNPETGRGKRGDARRLKDQMVRLFAASISFQQKKRTQTGVGQRTLGMLVAPRRELWWDPREMGQGNLWQSWIEIGEDFYDTLTSAPVPVDVRALRALNNSPLALDLYGWTTYKTYAVTMRGQPQFVSYSDFMAQLGADYGTVKDFKKKLHASLKKVQVVYPQLKIEAVTGGIRIHPSKPAVPTVQARGLLL
jgi:hypothetical protein